jgi:uncharacterized protein DUF2721
MTNVLSSAIAGGGPLGVIASMITPAFLILGAANLIGSSLTRLARSVDRARTVMERMNAHRQAGEDKAAASCVAQLRRYRIRGILVEISLAGFYLAIGCFVAASLAIALTHFSNHADSWIPAWLTVGGAVLLFMGTLLLFSETALATAMLRAEIDGALEGA